MRQVRRDNRRGFTLLELLLATIVAAVLMGALYSVFHSVLASQTRVYAALEAAAPASQIANVLRTDFESMTAPNGILNSGLVGETDSESTTRADTITFTASNARVSDDAPWGDVQKIVYTLADPADTMRYVGLDLTRTVTRNLLATSTDTEDPAHVDVVCHDVQAFEIEYYDGEYWTDTWD